MSILEDEELREDIDRLLAERDELRTTAELHAVALAAVQAMLRRYVHAGHLLQIEGVECLGRPDRCDKLAPCGFCELCDLLATPTDTSALRDFGLRVAKLSGRTYPPDAESIVDAVLRGETP